MYGWKLIHTLKYKYNSSSQVLQTYTFSTTFVKYAYIKFYENLTNGLVADARSEKDGRTERQTDTVSKQGIPFFTA